MVIFVNLVVKRVVHESDDVRTNDFSTFVFKHANDIVVCNRRIFDKNFADDGNARLLFVGQRNVVEIFDDF